MKPKRIRRIINLCLVLCAIFAAVPWVGIARDTSGLQDRLVDAAKSGDVTSVKTLLDRGANPNAHDHDGQMALTEASCSNYLNVVELLLAKGADINVRDGVGLTALIAASMKGHMEMVKLLLDKGADINAITDRDFSALQRATSVGRP